MVITGAGRPGRPHFWQLRRAAAATTWSALTRAGPRHHRCRRGRRAPIAGGDVVVNCAAFTNVDAAEADPDAAHAINAVGPGQPGPGLRAGRARLIHISTDYVFEGGADRSTALRDVDEPTGPLSVYGRSKLDGELAVHRRTPRGPRGADLVGVHRRLDGTDFVAVMRRLAAEDKRHRRGRRPDRFADLLAMIWSGRCSRSPQREYPAPASCTPPTPAPASRFDQARAVFAERRRRPGAGPPGSTPPRSRARRTARCTRRCRWCSRCAPA